MPPRGHLDRNEKIWRLWSRNKDPLNTNQIAKLEGMPDEGQVEMIIAAKRNERYAQRHKGKARNMGGLTLP